MVRTAVAVVAGLAAFSDAAFLGASPLQGRTSHRASVLQMGSTKDFKVGLTIEVEGQAWRVQEFLHVKPGKGPAFVRSKLKNLETGAVLDKTWKAGESFPDAQVDKEEMQFSVSARPTCHAAPARARTLLDEKCGHSYRAFRALLFPTVHRWRGLRVHEHGDV